jgi:predicted ATPase/DNA-binding CsgD family transcriptional regulator
VSSASPSAQSTNLPSPPTPLLGREREVAALVTLLRQDEVHLLTLTGPGGVGKTRLALHMAADVHDVCPDGVFFVSLAPITDPDLVIATIAQVLGVREAGDEPLVERLRAFLREKRLLLVLDNFEQVVEAAPLVADLLATCRGLTVLVTSRVRLRLLGEREHVVLPLGLLSPVASPSVEDALRSAAVQLFVVRAQAVQEDFALTNGNAQVILDICRRLDGLPLAIELAAARIKVLPPSALLARLEKRLPLLSGGARDLPARLQTMRDAIGWSYDLLRPEEQTLFRQLAIFAGGFTLEAAEAVATGAGDLGLDLFDGVASLIDKSLVRQDVGASDDPRYVILETVREFGWEELVRRAEEDATHERHAAWCLALAERAQPELDGPDQAKWLARLEAEHDNLRAALGWLRERGDTADGLRLGAALSPFWLRRGHLAEGRAQLRAVLARVSVAEHPLLRAEALSAAAVLAEAQGDVLAAQAAGEVALSLWRDLGDKRGAARSLLRLAWVTKTAERETALATESLALYRIAGHHRDLATALADLAGLARDQGDLERARSLLEESVALYRELGDRVGIAWPLAGLGFITWYEGDDGKARALFEQSLALFETAGDQRGITWATHSLGLVAWTQGDPVRAATLHETALTLARQIGDQREVAFVLAGLGYLAEDCGDFTQARERYAEALRIYQELEDFWGIFLCLEGLAGLTTATDAARTVRVLAATTALRETHLVPLPPVYQARHDRIESTARAQLGSAAFATAWDAGRAMALDEVVPEALSEPVHTEGNVPSQLPTDPATRAGLTGREFDVLCLLVEGRSDREIGEALFISHRTVTTHVSHILAKLGVESRTEAAAWTIRHGLA